MRPTKNIASEIEYCRNYIETLNTKYAKGFDYKALGDYINGGETNLELRQIVHDFISDIQSESASIKQDLKDLDAGLDYLEQFHP